MEDLVEKARTASALLLCVVAKSAAVFAYLSRCQRIFATGFDLGPAAGMRLRNEHQ
jgi:hypothetical protein